MIVVRTHQKSPRLSYVLDFCFKSRGIDYALSIEDKLTNKQIEICMEKGNSLDLSLSSLLFDEGIRSYEIDRIELKDQECLTFNGETDLLGSIFYVLTRYEEYVSTESDQHDRFKVTNSLQFKFSWMHKAMCDHWVKYIYDMLLLDYPVESVLVPTFDIDNVYAYRYKSGVRRSLSKLKDLYKGDKIRMAERRGVEGGMKDPYDTFSEIEAVLNRNDKARVFWLVAPLGKNDRNLKIDHPQHRKLIKHLDQKGQIGLHPGYSTIGNSEHIHQQKKSLENVLERSIDSSRQHFLRFNIAKTYRNLLDAGIRHEYSMGFAAEAGFRAGTARPFHWYDLNREEQTELLVHPFVYMDGTLNEYLKLSTDSAIQLIRELWEEVRTYGGEFVFIWHNETIGGYRHWDQWQRVLDETLKLGNE